MKWLRAIPACYLLIAVIFCADEVMAAGGQGDSLPQLPPLAASVLERAQKWMASGRPDQAVQVLSQFHGPLAENVTPEDRKGRHHPLIRYYLAKALHGSGDTAAAIRYLQTATRTFPAFSAAWTLLGDYDEETGLSEEAGSAYQRAYETDPSENPLLLVAAMATSYQAGKTDLCLKLAEMLEKKHPGFISTDTRPLLVAIYRDAGRMDAALPHIRLLAENTSGKNQQNWYRALLGYYLETGQRKDLNRWVDRLCRSYPEWDFPWQIRLQTALENKAYTRAVEAGMTLSLIRPLHMDEQVCLADLYLLAGMPQKALTLYEHLPEAAPDRSKQMVVCRQKLHLSSGENIPASADGSGQ